MGKKSIIWVFILKKIFLVILFLSTSAHAETKTFTYQVYAGGLHAIEAQLKIDIEDTKYAIAVDSSTRGWLASLVPWQGIFQTSGHVKNTTLAPTKHQAISTWRGKTETKTFTYRNNQLTSLTIAEEGSPTERPEIDEALTEHTTDLLSATLAVMQNMNTARVCEGEADIYDGKRRFTLSFKDKGESKLNASRYNIYDGFAHKCVVEIEPKGGRWHEKPRGWLLIQEQGRQKGALPTIWIGHIDGYDYGVPVKIQVKTDYGTLLMHLTSIN